MRSCEEFIRVTRISIVDLASCVKFNNWPKYLIINFLYLFPDKLLLLNEGCILYLIQDYKITIQTRHDSHKFVMQKWQVEIFTKIISLPPTQTRDSNVALTATPSISTALHMFVPVLSILNLFW